MAIFVFLAVGYLYQEKYLSCLDGNFSICIKSKKYVSPTNRYLFRYPNDYPISVETGEGMIKKYHFADEYVEWLNFSSNWYPNAGGERLGSITVEKKTDYKNTEEYASRVLNDFKSLPEQYRGEPPEIESVQISGKDTVRVSRSQQPSSFNPPSDSYVFIHNGELYNINFYYDSYYHKKPVDYYQKGKDLILSTFTLK